MPEELTRSAVRARHPLFNTLGHVLELGLNRLVALDPDSRMRIGALDGRALSVDFTGGLPAMRIAVEGDRLRIGPAFEGASALHVAATPGSLLALALAQGGAPLTAGRVEIAGDAELARRLERIATRFSPDFDEAFARVFGDVLGTRIAQSLRRGLAAAQSSVRALARDTAEFLTEEGRDLVANAEVDIFFDEVDDLRERTDRLAARVRRLRVAPPT